MALYTTPLLKERRRGKGAQLIYIPEVSGVDVDPTPCNGYVLNISDKVGYKTDRGLDKAPVYKGTALPSQVVDMANTAEGAITCGLDFISVGRPLRGGFGSAGYSQPEGNTGKLKRFVIPTALGWEQDSFQLIRRSNEATVQNKRTTGNKLSTFHVPFSPNGRCTFDMNAIGSGKKFTTNPAGLALTDDGYNSASYKNMQMIFNNYYVVGLTTFDETISWNLNRTDLGANNGYGIVDSGLIDAEGTFGTIWSITGGGIESDTTLSDLADNATEFGIDVCYADKTLGIATSWFRRRYWVRISAVDSDFGGAAGESQQCKWMMVNSSNAMWQAEIMGDTLGPYNTAVNNKLSIKVDGAAGIVTTLPTGAAVTTDAIVASINADAGINTRVFALNYNGRLMLVYTYTNKGSASSLAIDTAATNSAHTALGFTSTVYAGYGSSTSPCPLILDVYNQMAASY